MDENGNYTEAELQAWEDNSIAEYSSKENEPFIEFGHLIWKEKQKLELIRRMSMIEFDKEQKDYKSAKENYDSETNKITNKIAYTLGLKEKPEKPKEIQLVFSEPSFNHGQRHEIYTTKLVVNKVNDITTTFTEKQQQSLSTEFQTVKDTLDLVSLHPQKDAYLIAKHCAKESDGQKYWLSLAKEQEEEKLKNKETLGIDKDIAGVRLKRMRDNYGIQSQVLEKKEMAEQQEFQQRQSRGHSCRM